MGVSGPYVGLMIVLEFGVDGRMPVNSRAVGCWLSLYKGFDDSTEFCLLMMVLKFGVC